MLVSKASARRCSAVGVVVTNTRWRLFLAARPIAVADNRAEILQQRWEAVHGRALTGLMPRLPASQEMQYKHDEPHDEHDVNQTTGDVEREEPKQPQDNPFGLPPTAAGYTHQRRRGPGGWSAMSLVRPLSRARANGRPAWGWATTAGPRGPGRRAPGDHPTDSRRLRPRSPSPVYVRSAIRRQAERRFEVPPAQA